MLQLLLHLGHLHCVSFALFVLPRDSTSFSLYFFVNIRRIIFLIQSSRSIIPTNSTSAYQFSQTIEALLRYVTESTKTFIHFNNLLRRDLLFCALILELLPQKILLRPSFGYVHIYLFSYPALIQITEFRLTPLCTGKYPTMRRWL